MSTSKVPTKSPYQDNIEKARLLRGSGMEIRQIAKTLERPYRTVYGWVRNVRPGEDPTGHNADRHLCRTFQYRGYDGVNGCDYIENVHHSRGCKVAECDKYVKGPRIRRGDYKWKG